MSSRSCIVGVGIFSLDGAGGKDHDPNVLDFNPHAAAALLPPSEREKPLLGAASNYAAAASRPSWEEFRESQTKGKMHAAAAGTADAIAAYRHELDEARDKILARGSNHKGLRTKLQKQKKKEKKHKKKRKKKASDSDSDSDEMPKKKKKKARKSKAVDAELDEKWKKLKKAQRVHQARVRAVHGTPRCAMARSCRA